MQRITITIEDDLMAEVEPLMGMRGYEARSEVFRRLLRAGLERANEDAGGAGDCAHLCLRSRDAGALQAPLRQRA